MKKVLAALPNYSKYCARANAYLEENGCEVIENETGGPLSAEQLKEMVADIDAAVAGVEVWNCEIMDAAPKLKVLARFGTGVDNYDLEEAKKTRDYLYKLSGCKFRLCGGVYGHVDAESVQRMPAAE